MCTYAPEFASSILSLDFGSRLEPTLCVNSLSVFFETHQPRVYTVLFVTVLVRYVVRGVMNTTNLAGVICSTGVEVHINLSRLDEESPSVRVRVRVRG